MRSVTKSLFSKLGRVASFGQDKGQANSCGQNLSKTQFPTETFVAQVGPEENILPPQFDPVMSQVQKSLATVRRETPLDTLSYGVFQELELATERRGQSSQDVKDWMLFTLHSRDYCSPDRNSGMGLKQGGTVQFPGDVEYYRGDIGIQVFGGPRDEATALIRTQTTDSFRQNLVQRSAVYGYSFGFARVEDEKAKQRAFGILQSQSQFPALHLSFKDPLSDKERKTLLSTAQQRNTVLFVEEPCDPFGTGKRDITRTSVSDESFGGIIQEIAREGMGPKPEQITEHYLEAGRLKEILNPAPQKQSSYRQTGPMQGKEHLQRTLDYCASSLEQLETQDELDKRILDLTRKQVAKLQKNFSELPYLQAHQELRPALAFTAKLNEKLGQPDDSLRQAAQSEGGEVLFVNSGMGAYRLVAEAMKPYPNKVYTSTHYIEQDLMLEDVLGAGIHKVSHTDCPQNLSRTVSQKSAEGGQLLYLDQTIARMSDTKSFDLKGFCNNLKGQRLRNPVYLVYDNTVDPDQTNKETLFPEGIPHNLFLIRAASQAKLHQQGFDLVTGGIVQINSHPDQTAHAKELRQIMENQAERDDCKQSPFGLELLKATFYSHAKAGEQKDLMQHMVGWRRSRNTVMFNALKNELSTFNDTTQSFSAGVKDKAIDFHFEPNSNLHTHIQGDEIILTELRDRVFKRAEKESLNVAHGTSWGFPTTRIDGAGDSPYLRISVGLESDETVKKLGSIVGQELNHILKKSITDCQELMPRAPLSSPRSYT